MLQKRREYFLYEKGDADAAKQIREMMDLILLNKVKDYFLIEDFGLDLTMDLAEHKFIEERENGSKIITHYKGDKKWVTKE